MTDSPFPAIVSRLRDLAADPAAGVTDADLLARFVRQRDPVAFEALVWRHARLVMGTCRRTLRHRQDAEDAFQAVFLLLARKAHRIRRGNALPAWLHTTAVRIARRARSRRRPTPLPELPDVPTADPLPENAEALSILDAEVRRLSAPLRAAFVLCGLEGRTHADAARDLGVPKGTIDSRMAAAQRRLKAALARRGLALVPPAVVAATVPELAYSESARQAAALALAPAADVSPAVAGLLTSSAGSRWLVALAAALTVATAGTLITLGGPAKTSDPPKPPSARGKEAPPPKADLAARSFTVDIAAVWKFPAIGIPPGESDPAQGTAGLDWLSKQYATVVDERRKDGKPLIPPAVPVGADDLLIYAHGQGIGSIGLRDNKFINPPIAKRDFFWNLDSDYGLVVAARDLRARVTLDVLLRAHAVRDVADLLLHRTVSLSFFVDDTIVGTVDELGITPTDAFATSGVPPHFGVFDQAMRHNEIKFWDRRTGKLLQKLSGYAGRDREELLPKSPIEPTLYLGPPMKVGGQVYAIYQTDKQLRLTALHWRPLLDYFPKPGRDGKAAVAWNADLVTSPRPMLEDVYRRIHAIHLITAGDLVICPTHLGRVVAVEARTGKVRWTHEYAPLDAKRFPTFAPEWVVVPPVVAEDRYVYAPADFPELLCLNLADGKKVWSIKKGDGLYPAVVGDRVLIVGEKTIRSLSLKDGSEQWKSDLPGLPCGRGAVLGDTYLVPISEPKTWKGLIAVVELATGKVLDVLRPEKDEPIGNLVVHQDYLISQTLTEIAVFPIKKKE
jgi:RNA polymerase sigma factor (sigma-70 family)